MAEIAADLPGYRPSQRDLRLWSDASFDGLAAWPPRNWRTRPETVARIHRRCLVLAGVSRHRQFAPPPSCHDWRRVSRAALCDGLRARGSRPGSGDVRIAE